MDLLQFPKSTKNNILALVVVDHFSKFLIAIPLKDKRSIIVATAVKQKILPQLLRLPNRIMTDNGPEFRGADFNEVLADLTINHIFSTRYRASGNGAVERCNRTVIEFLKGLVKENPSSWDSELGKALIIYNSTWHSQINSSPSDFILKSAHSFNHNLNVDRLTVDT